MVVLALAATFVTTSCSKENKIIKQVEGTWDVTSIQNDGVEILGVEIFGSSITKTDLIFEDYDKSTEQGNFEQATTISVIGVEETTSVNGTYSIKDEGETLTLTAGGNSQDYTLVVDKTTIVLTSIGDSTTTRYEATRVQ